MFDQILQLVKDHFSNNPDVAAAIPPEQTDAVHHEIASHINNGLETQAPAEGGIGGLLSQFGGNSGGGNLATSAISGGLVGSLGSKFGLSPAITGAIAAALPGLIAKFAQQSAGQKAGGLSSFL